MIDFYNRRLDVAGLNYVVIALVPKDADKFRNIG
jgi:hypothetical protein